jgi:UDP-glucose 4-epimerase
MDAELVEREVQSVDLVFHLAAAVGVRHIVDDPLGSLLVNTRGSENVLSTCFRYWKKVVLASTSEVYGKTSKVPMAETDDRVLGPTSIHRWSYSTSKAIDEHLALAYHQLGLPVAIVRYFNSYGPRIDEKGYGSVVANFIRQARSGSALTIHGDGSQTRCFTYASDTVEGTYLAGFTDDAVGQVINLGSTRETTILELAQAIQRALGTSSAIELVDYASYYGKGFEDTRRRVPDISRANQILKWSPKVDLDSGLVRTIEWWKQRHG